LSDLFITTDKFRRRDQGNLLLQRRHAGPGKHRVNADGGLTDQYAKEMEMKPNLLPEQQLSQAAAVDTRSQHRRGDSTSANVRNWMECIRSRKKRMPTLKAGTATRWRCA